MRRCFYSFHYEKDAWRAAQVRNIGVIERSEPLRANEWEKIKRQGESAIERWIDNQLYGRTCTIVLVGENTANRKWVMYEVASSWNRGMGVLGIRIHGLLDADGRRSRKGKNPFALHRLSDSSKLNECAELHDPNGRTSQDTYAIIQENLEDWVEAAIEVRKDCGNVKVAWYQVWS